MVCLKKYIENWGLKFVLQTNTDETAECVKMKLKVKSESVREIMKQYRIPLTQKQKNYLRVKRVLDVLVSACALIILAIPFMLMAILQKISSPSEPVLFRQKRVGQNSKTFYILKFRTMKSSAPKYSSSGALQNPEVHITKLGRILRNTSIDELPQLWNVLIGDMSLVGPRPLIRHERDVHYLRRYYGVDQLKPGITGWAQVNGRDLLNDYDKVYYDREYLRNVSAIFDLEILLDSVLKVLGRKDIHEGIAARKRRDEFHRCEIEQKDQEMQKSY